MKQPEVGDEVQYVTLVDGFPAIIQAPIKEVTVDFLILDNGEEINPDLNQEMQINNLRVGLWRYAP